MWSLDTRWFDVAIVMTLFAFGSILFGLFEQHKPRGRRVAKVVLVLLVTIVLIETAGRMVAYSFLALPLLAGAYVHLWWLPKRGVNGWTGEPRERYLELVSKK